MISEKIYKIFNREYDKYENSVNTPSECFPFLSRLKCLFTRNAFLLILIVCILLYALLAYFAGINVLKSRVIDSIKPVLALTVLGYMLLFVWFFIRELYENSRDLRKYSPFAIRKDIAMKHVVIFSNFYKECKKQNVCLVDLVLLREALSFEVKGYQKRLRIVWFVFPWALNILIIFAFFDKLNLISVIKIGLSSGKIQGIIELFKSVPKWDVFVYLILPCILVVFITRLLYVIISSKRAQEKIDCFLGCLNVSIDSFDFSEEDCAQSQESS